MSTPEYRIVTQVHVNRLDPLTGTVSPGFDVTYRDTVTGTVDHAFVSDDNYSAENVRAVILARLKVIRDVHRLDG